MESDKYWREYDSVGNLYASVSICQIGIGIVQSTNYIGQIDFWVIDTPLVGIKEGVSSKIIPLKTEFFPPKPNPFVKKILIA